MTTSEPSTPSTGPAADGRGPVRRVIGRTLGKAWDDDIFSHSAQAAFWQALSLPPLFLALLGSLGYVSGWFGPETLQIIDGQIINFSRRVFTPEVVDQIIVPTADSILTRGRADVVSVGFIVALWAGSSAMASIVDSVTEAHSQKLVRHPVWQRIFSLLIYLFGLIVAVFTLPVIALGPDLLPEVLPESWRPVAESVIQAFYYPVAGIVLVFLLTALYWVALPHSLPPLRLVPGALLAMVVFIASTAGLRLYISFLTSTGYTYGALATPIAFLLFAFLLGFSIVLGAHLNNGIDEVWPSQPARGERRSKRVREAAKRFGPERDRTGRDGAALDGPALDGPQLDGPQLDGPQLDGAAPAGTGHPSTGHDSDTVHAGTPAPRPALEATPTEQSPTVAREQR